MTTLASHVPPRSPEANPHTEAATSRQARTRTILVIALILVALFAMGMPVLHFTVGADLTKHSGAFFFVWTLIALGVVGMFSVILSMLEIRGRLRPNAGDRGE